MHGPTLLLICLGDTREVVLSVIFSPQLEPEQINQVISRLSISSLRIVVHVYLEVQFQIFALRGNRRKMDM